MNKKVATAIVIAAFIAALGAAASGEHHPLFTPNNPLYHGDG